MLLKLFKSNQPFIVFILPILGIVLWIPSLADIRVVNVDLSNTSTAFEWLYNLINIAPIVPTVFALVLLIFESFLLIRLNFKFMFIEHKTYLPSVMFLVFASIIGQYQTINTILIGTLFLLLAINRTFIIDKKRNVLKRYFESGFFLGLGAIFYPNIYIFIFIIWLTLVIVRTFNWREWFISIVGLLTPFVFYLAILFLTDKYGEVFSKLMSILFNPVSEIPLSTYSVFIFLFLALVTVIAIIKGLSIVRIKKISSRKYFNIFVWFLLYTVVMFFVYPSVGYELIIPLSIPMSIIYSVFFTEFKSKWFGEVVFSLIILSAFTIIWL